MNYSKVLRVKSAEPDISLAFHQNESGLISLSRVSLAEYPVLRVCCVTPFSGVECEFCKFCCKFLPMDSSSCRGVAVEDEVHRWARCRLFCEAFGRISCG